MVDPPVPEGPTKLGDKGQITVPKALRAALGLHPGSQVWVSLNPDRPGTLVVLPREVMQEVFEKGWTAIG